MRQRAPVGCPPRDTHRGQEGGRYVWRMPDRELMWETDKRRRAVQIRGLPDAEQAALKPQASHAREGGRYPAGQGRLGQRPPHRAHRRRSPPHPRRLHRPGAPAVAGGPAQRHPAVLPRGAPAHARRGAPRDGPARPAAVAAQLADDVFHPPVHHVRRPRSAARGARIPLPLDRPPTPAHVPDLAPMDDGDAAALEGL